MPRFAERVNRVFSSSFFFVVFLFDLHFYSVRRAVLIVTTSFI